MSDTPKIRKLSKESFIAFAVLAALALMADLSALVLVTTWLRATEAAYAVYGVAVALTLTAGVILLIRRKDIAVTAKDAVLAARFVASLRRFSVFERAFSDYGWRTLLSALVVLAGNIVYVSYLIWMAVAYISPWYAALAGFYAWLVIMRAGVVLAERLTAKRAGTPEAPARDRHIIAVINGSMLIVAGGVIAAPAVQMAIGLYPHGGGIRDIVINAVFAAVKCTSAIVQCADVPAHPSDIRHRRDRSRLLHVGVRCGSRRHRRLVLRRAGRRFGDAERAFSHQAPPCACGAGCGRRAPSRRRARHKGERLVRGVRCAGKRGGSCRHGRGGSARKRR